MAPQNPTDENLTNHKQINTDIEQNRLKFGKFLASPPTGDEIVISGLAGQFPDSDDVYHFRDNLYNKVDMVTEDTRRWEHNHPEIPKRGGKLNHIEQFDAGFFGVNFRQAESMCPMVRLHLQSATECIMDAGLHPSDLEGAKCGVFVGVCFAETEKKWFYDNLKEKYNAITGCLKVMIANRVSYYLKVNGPSVTIDTACSSSLFALEHAYKMIRLGQIDCAIVGGTSATLHPYITLQFAQLGVLSMDGTCRSFDAEGSGYARSEAVCSIFLQKAKDAKRIYGQIIHARTNCDGFKTQGITYPSSEMQTQLLSEFYEECGVNPDDISFLEAHGTGTKVGDPEECLAVDAIFCKNRVEPVRIGAVKSNIGHSEAAAGVCSLTKIIIAMENGMIPPNLHFKKPREGVEALERGKLKVITEKTPFDRDNVLIGLNSFGFGGGNCHVLLQWNNKGKKNEGVPEDDIPRLVCVGGRTRQAVNSLLDSVNSRKLDGEYIRLINHVYRKHICGHLFRGYTIVSKNGEIGRKEQYFGENQELLYLIFSGFESGWYSIGKHLLNIPLFAVSILKIHNILSKKNINITEILMNNKSDSNPIDSILGNMAVQIGISDILKTIELIPSKIVGYSFGELICAYNDSILTLEEVILSTLTICSAIKSICKPLEQYVIKLSSDKVEQIIPANVEITGIVSEKEVLISGPKESLSNFVNSLKNKRITAEYISTNVNFMKKDVGKIVPQLVQRLKKLISNPKVRSERWVLSVVNGLASPESFVKALTCQTNFNNLLNEIPKKSIIFEIGSTTISKILEQHLEKKNVLIHSLQECSRDSVGGLLEALGSMYNLGFNFEIDKLYPEVQFPVSRSTPMISPYVKWHHDYSWSIFSYKSGTDAKNGVRSVFLSHIIDQYKYMSGHVIDGRVLVPASGYLILVWETLAIISGNMHCEMAVVFENVKFHRATTLKYEPTELIIMIQRRSGNFEIGEGGTAIVTGRISMFEDNKDQTGSLPIYKNDGSIKMTTKDVYKDMRLRGYGYKGDFRGIVETNLPADRGTIKWDGNWVTFIDNMLQMKILSLDSRLLYVPTGIRKMILDPKKQTVSASETSENTKIPVYVYHDCNIINAGGIEIQGLLAMSIPRRKQRGEPVLEKYIFVPNHQKLTCPQSVRVNIQICLENISSYSVKAIEIIDEVTKENSEPLAGLVVEVLGDLPLIQPNIKVLTKNEISIPNVTIEDTKLVSETDCLLVIGSELMKRAQVLHTAFGVLKDHGFVISREAINFNIESINTNGIDVVTVHKTEKECFVMIRKSKPYENPLAVDIFDPEQSFSWLPDVQSAVRNSSNVVIYVQNEQSSGAIGLVNCLRREPGGNKIKCVYISDSKAPKFDISNAFYTEQLKKNLAMNVLKDGKWGTYRHILLENIDEVESEHSYVNIRTRGDLSSLKWIQGPLTFNAELPTGKELVCIYNSSLNFRDIMTASGRINADVITMDRREQESVQGFEYSGRTLNGKRVMGMANSCASATLIAAESNLLFEVPNDWTLEQAATVPVVYSTALLSLVDAGDIKRSDTILIHSGAGGVGQAAISVALSFGCRIYTTVGTPEKREFLKKRYPQLKDRHIGNSRDTSFEQLIYTGTEGRGVDIVLNSLAEDKLMASARCLARGGRFVEIGKFDLAQNTNFRLALLEKECSFHGIMLDTMLKSSVKKQHLRELVLNSMASGAVRPLNAHVYKSNEVEQAFRFMASGKHMGKVMINIRKEESKKICPPKPLIMKCIPSYICSEERTYVICGGLGGFGLELADWLILRGATKIVLSSRSGVRTGYQASRIRLWNSYGIHIHISTDDITTRAGCEQMLKEANKLGPVEAIFNLAVVLKDALFTNQTVENFQVSFGPKADATKHLDEASRKLCPQLNDFVIFSSVSCGLGNPGQTNYGMANSVMERLCEKRQQDGLPALAIEWGAIGDVGLVAEMQEVHTELEIGGTLQQRISSCLRVMDSFLKQKNTIVSSMVVAEKRIGRADNIVDAVANILGVNDLKTISMHSTLAELGMDSITAVEIKQTLEREYEVFLTAQDIRSMTFSKLQQIEAEKESDSASAGKKVEKLPEGIELILRVMGDETSANIPVMRLPSQVKEGAEAPTIFLLPGIEGVAKAVSPLARNLNCHALGLQFCHDDPEDTIRDTALSRLPHIQRHLTKKEPFTIVAYSFGVLLGLEIVALLEQNGYSGKLIIIDASPKMLMELMKQQLVTDSEDQFQTGLLCTLMSLHVPSEIIMQSQEKIFKANGFEERMKTAYECTPKDTSFSPTYLRITAIGLYKRLKGLISYKPSFKKLKSSGKLFKPKQLSMFNLPEDYDLSEYFEKPVEVRIFEGNHITVLENLEAADAISSEAGATTLFTKEFTKEKNAGKGNAEQIKVK